jgi:hypothetical protein
MWFPSSEYLLQSKPHCSDRPVHLYNPLYKIEKGIDLQDRKSSQVSRRRYYSKINMRFECLLFTFSLAIATVLPFERNTLVKRWAPTTDDVDPRLSSTEHKTIEGRAGRPHTSRCSTTCGSPSLQDCIRLLSDQFHNNPPLYICTPPERAAFLSNGSYGLSYVNNHDDQTLCIATNDMLKFSTQLFHGCAECQGVGGCFLLDDGSSTSPKSGFAYRVYW